MYLVPDHLRPKVDDRLCSCVIRPEAVKLKKEAFQAWMSQGSPEAADRYWGLRGLQHCWCWSYNSDVGGIREDYGERLSVGLKDVLVNHSTTQKGKAGIFPGRDWPGWRITDPNWGYCWGRWKEDFEDLLNPAIVSSIKEAESENLGEGLSIVLGKIESSLNLNVYKVS